jgi:predicted MFS family arabinose efflux permease
MTAIQSPLHAVLVYGLLFGIGSAATSITPIGVMITRRFPERAGFANSIAIAGMGVGQLLIIMLLTSQLHRLGWRGTFVALALVNLLILLPLVVLALRAQTDRVGDSSTQPAADAAGQKTDYAFLRSRRLWLLLVIYAICGFQDFFTATHVVAFALDQGVSPLLAGNMLAFMGLSGLAGVLAAGVWSDRNGPLWPTAACFVLRMVIFALILISRETWVILLFALLYGATFWVTAPLTVVFARQEFGNRQMGVISGLITMVHHFAGGLGAYAGAAIFDIRGNYDNAFQLMLVLSVIATVLTWLAAGRHRKKISSPIPSTNR